VPNGPHRLILRKLVDEANRALVGAIRVAAAPDTKSPADELRPSIESSGERVREATAQLLRVGHLDERSSEFERVFRTSLDDGRWIDTFPGRFVLSEFVTSSVDGVNYEALRNLILDQMVDDGFQPNAMKVTTEQVL
jgi:hypothetical protein